MSDGLWQKITGKKKKGEVIELPLKGESPAATPEMPPQFVALPPHEAARLATPESSDKSKQGSPPLVIAGSSEPEAPWWTKVGNNPPEDPTGSPGMQGSAEKESTDGGIFSQLSFRSESAAQHAQEINGKRTQPAPAGPAGDSKSDGTPWYDQWGGSPASPEETEPDPLSDLASNPMWQALKGGRSEVQPEKTPPELSYTQPAPPASPDEGQAEALEANPLWQSLQSQKADGGEPVEPAAPASQPPSPEGAAHEVAPLDPQPLGEQVVLAGSVDPNIFQPIQLDAVGAFGNPQIPSAPDAPSTSVSLGSAAAQNPVESEPELIVPVASPLRNQQVEPILAPALAPGEEDLLAQLQATLANLAKVSGAPTPAPSAPEPAFEAAPEAAIQADDLTSNPEPESATPAPEEVALVAPEPGISAEPEPEALLPAEVTGAHHPESSATAPQPDLTGAQATPEPEPEAEFQEEELEAIEFAPVTEEPGPEPEPIPGDGPEAVTPPCAFEAISNEEAKEENRSEETPELELVIPEPSAQGEEEFFVRAEEEKAQEPEASEEEILILEPAEPVDLEMPEGTLFAPKREADVEDPEAADKRLGLLLLENKLITKRELEKALRNQTKTGQRLGQILIEQGSLTEKRLLQVISAQKGISPWSLETDHPTQEALECLSNDFCRKHQVLPVALRGDLLLLAIASPDDHSAIEAARIESGKRVEPVLADPGRISSWLRDERETSSPALDRFVNKAVETSSPVTVKVTTNLADEETRPVVGLVNHILQDAIRLRASDVHIEPQSDKAEIRYRLDGELVKVRNIPHSILPMVTTRIKIMAEIDIVEYRIPQDGRITVVQGKKTIDIRVSVLPTVHGQRLVLRILDRTSGLKPLESLGFERENLNLFRQLVDRPYGLFLVTGPTGSGKTTTLYSALQELRKPGINVMTCEDPVEYDLPGINQSQVNEKVGLTFATQLRAILRQDPDVVLVGEIRDQETAETAVRAALTGHLVLSTLHCNDAPSAVARLLDMGVDPYLLSTALSGTMSQRLVRTLCPDCKRGATPTDQEKTFLAQYFGAEDVQEIWHPVGCKACFDTGYRGRQAVHEVMPVTDEVGRLIARRAPVEELREVSSYYGYLPMQQDALSRVIRGETSLEEARRMVAFDTITKRTEPRRS
ncbi:MAG: Flp pilus assembly complex ATPase component TadA [Fimbriimonadaceae bacterium]|nr:Flp pilus assembly complex ATPase component TadA [Fimbriimonadaceae bacterium]